MPSRKAEDVNALHDAPDTHQRMQPEDRDAKENEETEEETKIDDWGHVDPLDGPFSSDMDPSGPGSAV